MNSGFSPIKITTQLWSIAINSGIHEADSLELQKKIRLLNQTLIFSTSVLVTFIALNLIFSYHNDLTSNLLISSIVFAAYIFNRYRKRIIGTYILTVLVPFLLQYYPLKVGNIGVEYYFILLALQVFYTIDNKKIVFSISLYLLFLLLFSKHIIYNAGNSKLSTEHEKIYYYVNITASFLYMIFTTNLFKQDTLRYQSLIEKQSKELHESIKEISNKEKVTSKLLQELNHRVKNNLQMVSMLLSSQSLKSDNDMLRQALIDVQTRIDCISLLHNQLYKSNTDLKPDIKAYLENLTKHILNISGKEDEAELIITIPSFRVNTEIATHLGLITNELLTNALKYGTNPKGEKNRIDISIHTNNTPKEFILFVSNDISEKEVEIPESTGFGLSFVKLITKQYNGYYTYDIDERYNVSVALKIKEIETEGEVNKLEQIVYYE